MEVAELQHTVVLVVVGSFIWTEEVTENLV